MTLNDEALWDRCARFAQVTVPHTKRCPRLCKNEMHEGRDVVVFIATEALFGFVKGELRRRYSKPMSPPEAGETK